MPSHDGIYVFWFLYSTDWLLNWVEEANLPELMTKTKMTMLQKTNRLQQIYTEDMPTDDVENLNSAD